MSYVYIQSEPPSAYSNTGYGRLDSMTQLANGMATVTGQPLMKRPDVSTGSTAANKEAA